MNYYPFDSRNKLYKPHFGAVKQGQSLLLRLVLHNDAKVKKAFLSLCPDQKEPYEIELKPKEYIEDYRFYDTEIKLNTGLYFYHFRYESEYGEFFVKKTDTSLGIVSDVGDDWQLTVYNENFRTPDFLSGGIIYQIFPDRFYNSGNEKKNVPSDRFLCSDWTKVPEYRQNNGPCSLGNDYYGGDIDGITVKLPYLKELGVTLIYLNPIFEAHSNHRYNTADYMKIDPLLGDEKSLKNLCKTAEKYGISVILDGVFSHTGDDSIYFDRYMRYDKNGAFFNLSSPYRKWYTFGNFDCGYKAWWGVPSLPEVNEENDSYLEFITGKNGVLKKWLSLGIKGYRLDVADELPDKFIKKIRKCVKEENKDAYILGEVWEDASNKISYSSRREFLLGDELDSVMNYPFSNAIIDFVCTANAYKMNETVLNIIENYPREAVRLLMNHIGTHDTPRVITRIANYGKFCGDREWQSNQIISHFEYNFAVMRLKIAAVLQYTLPGIPSLYYGDEAGLIGFGDPFCRGTYPWGNENTDLLSYYKALGNLRIKCDCLKDGDYIPLIADGGLLVYKRESCKDSIIVALNPTENYREFNTDLSEFGTVVFGENIAEEKNKITLKPYGYAIIK